jgi:F-type H+-transporting ATPase subunit gamma
METLESLKKKIESTDDLQAVVRTMKALAAVSIRQYEQAVQSLNEYNRTIEMGLHVVLKDIQRETITAEAVAGGLGVVIFGSDQGMCGQFNEQIASFAMSAMQKVHGGPGEVRGLVVGVRVLPHIEAIEEGIDERIAVPASVAGIAESVQDVVLKIEAWRSEGHIGRIVLFYNETREPSGYEPVMKQIFPVDIGWLEKLKEMKWPSKVLPTFTMDSRRLFSALIRQYLFVSIYRAFAESLASENASRLAAMQLAEKNINERLGELDTDYHRQRQGSITAELLDIAAGFEALEGAEEGTSPR